MNLDEMLKEAGLGGRSFRDILALMIAELERLWPENERLQAEIDRLRAVNEQLVEACQAFVTAWEKSHQLEKTDVALRMAKAALEAARGSK